ncbi:MAG: hypothetical protein ACJ0BI_05990 [Paracoccaceae bacterium]
MSLKNPIISFTGSSGIGTSMVKYAFEKFLDGAGVTSSTVEGDAFNRFNRQEMEKRI